MKILYIEDSPSSIRVLERIALLLGHEMVVATNGAEGLEQVDRSVNLIFMDIGLPDTDGLTLTRQIRAQFPDLPIIAATAHVGATDRDWCMEAGCTDYIGKPYRIPALIELIKSYEAPDLPASPGE